MDENRLPEAEWIDGKLVIEGVLNMFYHGHVRSCDVGNSPLLHEWELNLVPTKELDNQTGYTEYGRVRITVEVLDDTATRAADD